jgi:hypothetical protein
MNPDLSPQALRSTPNNPERFARFGREAHVLAPLNHPQIAAMYALEEDAGEIVALARTWHSGSGGAEIRRRRITAAPRTLVQRVRWRARANDSAGIELRFPSYRPKHARPQCGALASTAVHCAALREFTVLVTPSSGDAPHRQNI